MKGIGPKTLAFLRQIAAQGQWINSEPSPLQTNALPKLITLQLITRSADGRGWCLTEKGRALLELWNAHQS